GMDEEGLDLGDLELVTVDAAIADGELLDVSSEAVRGREHPLRRNQRATAKSLPVGLRKQQPDLPWPAARLGRDAVDDEIIGTGACTDWQRRCNQRDCHAQRDVLTHAKLRHNPMFTSPWKNGNFKLNGGRPLDYRNQQRSRGTDLRAGGPYFGVGASART